MSLFDLVSDFLLIFWWRGFPHRVIGEAFANFSTAVRGQLSSRVFDARPEGTRYVRTSASATSMICFRSVVWISSKVHFYNSKININSKLYEN